MACCPSPAASGGAHFNHQNKVIRINFAKVRDFNGSKVAVPSDELCGRRWPEISRPDFLKPKKRPRNHTVRIVSITWLPLPEH